MALAGATSDGGEFDSVTEENKRLLIRQWRYSLIRNANGHWICSRSLKFEGIQLTGPLRIRLSPSGPEISEWVRAWDGRSTSDPDRLNDRAESSARDRSAGFVRRPGRVTSLTVTLKRSVIAERGSLTVGDANRDGEQSGTLDFSGCPTREDPTD